jgi:hypothetical protein
MQKQTARIIPLHPSPINHYCQQQQVFHSQQPHPIAVPITNPQIPASRRSPTTTSSAGKTI